MKYCIIICLLIISINSFSQTKDSCTLWDGYISSKSTNSDTLKIKVRYLGVNENIYFHPYLKTDLNNQFYKNLQNKYKLNLCFGFQTLDCNKGYCYPLIYKTKYDFTLFHRKNKEGKYVDWEEGTILEATIIRYNKYFEDGKELITIISDLKPIK